jgi:hypothetical protein
MSDQNKIALLALLLVLVIAIWTKPGFNKTEIPAQTTDIFQETENESNFTVISKEKREQLHQEKMLALKKTGEGPFGDSPFN